MTPGFLEYYNSELNHIRHLAGEFARAYPKVAARLDLDPAGQEICPDPFVERLLEGFAYLAARTRLKLDAEFPKFTQGLLETIHPEYLSPMPSMAVVRFAPDKSNTALAEGFKIPRGTSIQTARNPGELTACVYRTAHDVTLWPVEVEKAFYLDRGVHSLGLPDSENPAAVLHLELNTTGGLNFSDLKLETLTFYLRGGDSRPARVMEHAFAQGSEIWVRDARRPGSEWRALGIKNLKPVGLSPEEALIPTDAATFDGYRLLMEYFAFPQRFLFFSISGLDTVRPQSRAIDVALTLRQADHSIGRHINATLFDLFCTPVINLFKKRTDRVRVPPARSEHHVVVDRTRPTDFEIYSIESVTGYSDSSDQKRDYQPFFRSGDRDVAHEAFFSVNRRQRTASGNERKYGSLTSYVGSEVFLSLVDTGESQEGGRVSELGITAYCTNRHLPIRLSQGGRSAEFTVELNGPVLDIQCLTGPTAPQPSHAMGETAWRIISHLSLNYVTLTDSSPSEGASALRELLKLYLGADDRSGRRQLDGVLSVTHKPVLRRVPAPGMIVFGRGLEISVLFDEDAFAGTGIFLLGMVLEQFFARHVSINSFTETVILSKQRGEIIRWPARNGRRHVV